MGTPCEFTTNACLKHLQSGCVRQRKHKCPDIMLKLGVENLADFRPGHPYRDSSNCAATFWSPTCLGAKPIAVGARLASQRSFRVAGELQTEAADTNN